MVAGPSIGQFYGNFEGRALLGIGLRGLAAVGCVVAGVSNNSAVAWIFYLALLASDVIDITSVGSLVHKRNDELRKASLTLAPVVFPDKKGIAAGLQFRIDF